MDYEMIAIVYACALLSLIAFIALWWMVVFYENRKGNKRRADDVGKSE